MALAICSNHSVYITLALPSLPLYWKQICKRAN